MNYRQQGFTLTELMVAMILGLLLVAAAIQLFINGQIAYKVQQAGATIQDSGIFGLSYMTQSMRLANYGNLGAMNDETKYGGIVLSGNVAETKAANTKLTADRPGNLSDISLPSTPVTGYLTAHQATDSAYGDKSDQLVIMYQAPINTQNCEGKNVTGPVRTATAFTDGQYVIEKYFIKKTGSPSAPDASLYCNSAVFNPGVYDLKDASGIVQDYGKAGTGTLLLNHIEAMKVQLIVRTSSGIQTKSIKDYKDLVISDTPTGSQVKARPAIIGINLSLLIRSADKAGQAQGEKEFKLFDTTYTAPDDGYMRKVYVTTIALRNGGLNGELIQ